MEPTSKDGGAKVRYANLRVDKLRSGLYIAQARVVRQGRWSMVAGRGETPREAIESVMATGGADG